MKHKTLLIGKFKDDSAKGVGIYRVSATGEKLGENLDGPSACRFCEGVTMSYSNAFDHSSKLLCNKITAPYAISCLICEDFTTTRPLEFFTHVKENHNEILQQTTYLECPEGMRSDHFKTDSCEKVLAMMWMVVLVKKIIQA